ncbi:MAG TPA: ferredoxin [Deltaproteobacteria bacterium]|nr:ferredoxin [Deltaproteobacteria bacterium]HQB38286.1 ferredoxin [Deltaproteobacteria bacterium]
MRVFVDRDLCMGCKACEVRCPRIFKVDGESKSTVIAKGELAGEDLDCAKLAEDACPTAAIRVQQHQ